MHIKNKSWAIIAMTFFCYGLLHSCTYEKIEPITELPKDVSFSATIIPMFNTHCNNSACHDAGAIPPDLSPQNAYDDLVKKSGMIDLTTPENSELYKRMIDAGSPMPLTGVLPYESAQVLSWIKDGALNN